MCQCSVLQAVAPSTATNNIWITHEQLGTVLVEPVLNLENPYFLNDAFPLYTWTMNNQHGLKVYVKSTTFIYSRKTS